MNDTVNEVDWIAQGKFWASELFAGGSRGGADL
jgi:hypothetical protein